MKTAMKNSISEVLETMFFLPLDFPPDSDAGEASWNSDAEKTIAAKLKFSGPFEGHFVFLVPGDSALSIAADFLGIDENSITKDQITETVKEMINMLVGNTFSHYDDQELFNLDIPELISFDEAWGTRSGNEEEILVLFNTLEDQLALKMISKA